jgi:hypothetical protein
MILLFAPAIGAEYIGCDLAPENSDDNPDNDVVNIVVIQDGATIIRPYEVDTVKNKVKLIDTSTIAQGSFEFMFENSQGRRSDPVAFNLAPKPAGCMDVKLYQ